MKIAIDLLWLRPSKVGGTEFYIRNLLDGFMMSDMDFEFVLLLSKDNCDTFEKYMEDKRFTRIVANVNSANIGKRIIWQNLNQNRLLRKHHIKNCFTPVYCRPVFNGGITYINTIHDLQAYHYPQYHPKYEVWYSKICWIASCLNSKKLVAISQWVKDDIVEKYHVKPEKIEVIYNSVNVDDEECEFQVLEKKLGVAGEYYYTVAQLIPHKNLETLINVMDKIVHQNLDLPKLLLISGINGNATDAVKRLIQEKGLTEHVKLTGFVSNKERNTLYKYCKAFLFPSIFEGFGMPPVEAMALGCRVITTRCTCIPEVTQGKANYVENPFDVDEWINVMVGTENHSSELDVSRYNRKTLAEEYCNMFKQYFDKN